MKTTVRKHRRRIGGRKVKVKRHTRKTKGTRISGRKRKVFTRLAQNDFEVGGQLDFERGNLENARLHFGNGSELEFPWDPDYEVSYHTHPNLYPYVRVSVLPSYQDLISMKETKEREQIIFYRNIAVSVAESEKFQHTPNSKIKKVSNELGKDFKAGMSDYKMVKKYKPIFKKELGLDITFHGPNKPIALKSRSR